MATLRLRSGTPADARNRRIIASRYLEIADLAAVEEGAGANNVVVGIAVLAGIAASDAICISATGSRYAGMTMLRLHVSLPLWTPPSAANWPNS